MAITSANQLELLQTAEAVAREKMIDPGLVIEAMEDSLARAAKSRYGAEMDIRVVIDRKTGNARFTRVRTVVEDDAVENYQAQFTARDAKPYFEVRKDARWLRDGAPVEAFSGGPQVGDIFEEQVPPVELGRIAAQSAKQVILQRVREAERDRQYEEFKDRAGTIINGVVKREEYGNIIVDVGRGEAILRRNEKIGRESYRPNDRIRAYVKDVRREARGPHQGRGQVQRACRKPVPEGHRRRRDRRPARGHQRLAGRRLGHLDRGRLVEAQVAQELLLALGAQHLGDADGAHVRGLADDVPDGQLAAIVVEVVDQVLADLHRRAGVDHRVGIDELFIQRLRDREQLEGRSQLVAPLRGAVVADAGAGRGGIGGRTHQVLLHAHRFV